MLREVPGKYHDYQELREFRRLNLHGPYVDPSLGALGADADNVHREEHNHGDAIDEGQVSSQPSIVEEGQRYRSREAHDEPQALVQRIGLPIVGASEVHRQNAQSRKSKRGHEQYRVSQPEPPEDAPSTD